ncbi:FkbM family methyltransferase [Litoreibacter sp.]|nr:FkbM family methyltransferase [Litoreibacter sp.]
MAQFELNGVALQIPAELLTMKIRQKLKSGKYEGHEARAAQLVIDYGDRVLDLGSGIGYVATICAMLAGAENVVTVEANPDLLDVIRGNLDANDCAEATLVHGAAVGRATSDGTVALTKARAFWASSVGTGQGAQTVNVPAILISELLAKHRPTVVMMDVEGAEADMFDAPWPDHVRVVILELHQNRYPDTVIRQIFDTMSTSDLIYSPNLSRGAIVGFCRVGQGLDGSDS